MTSAQLMSVILAALPVVLLLGFGIAALWVRSTGVASICEALAHGGVGVGGILYLYLVIPMYKALFMDMGAELPAMTKIVIGLSDLTVNYWYILLFGVIASTALDVLAFATFHRVPESRYVACIFSAIVSCGLLITMLFAGGVIIMSQAAMLEAL